MVKLLIGKKGTGKTKALIDRVNAASNVAKGNVVFISNNTSSTMFDVSRNVRMTDTSDFEIINYSEFEGFICGIISQDNDLEEMYLDSFLTIADVKTDEEITKAIEKLDCISEKFAVKFILSVSKDEEDLPECAKAKIVVSL